MKNGDLEKQPEPLDSVTISADAGSAAADPAATESASTKPTATEPSATERPVISLEPVAKESLWQKLRKQPRETAAIVVLVVTAIIWLDSGDTNSQKNGPAKSLDPMDGFESYLSDLDTKESNAPLRESADPAETQSPASFGGNLTIPSTQQPEFASQVTANYGDSVFEPRNPARNNRDSATTTAQYPADADAYGSPAYRANAGGAEFNTNNSDSQKNRRVRFAGRIKPAN